MILSLLICGKLKAGPETELVRDYVKRAARQGRGLGISDVSCQEITLRAGIEPAAATQLALAAVPKGAKRIALDETGRNISTKQFAEQLNQWREQGAPAICVMVGPADGWAEPARAEADLVLSFGKMTWPHKLVHAMAAEQIYRAISILTNSPYHRGDA